MYGNPFTTCWHAYDSDPINYYLPFEGKVWIRISCRVASVEQLFWDLTFSICIPQYIYSHPFSFAFDLGSKRVTRSTQLSFILWSVDHTMVGIGNLNATQYECCPNLFIGIYFRSVKGEISPVKLMSGRVVLVKRKNKLMSGTFWWGLQPKAERGRNKDFLWFVKEMPYIYI